MYDFEYHRPAAVQEAARILGAAADGRYLAGGQSLLPTLKLRLDQPSDLVDLAGLDGLRGIRREGQRLVIGAMTLHAEVAASPEVRGAIPALASLAGGIGDPQVRNRGTLGGALAHNDPAGDYPAGVLGLGATVRTDQREISADDFFVGMFETALGPAEIILEVSFPIPERAGYVKFPNPASRYAIAGVMVAKGDDGVRVAVTGAAAAVFRQGEMERALEGTFAASSLDRIRTAAEGMNTDLHASADYRAHLVGVMAQRAVAASA